MRIAFSASISFDIGKVFGDLIRDQYQGGSTVLTAISGVEIACWDLIGKACGQPVYKLLGGRARERLSAYANVSGWNPIRHGEFVLPDQPSLGLELNEQVCAQHPYRKNSFPSLWDQQWVTEFTKDRPA